VREAFERSESFEKIVAGCDPGLAQFAREREALLLYR
jgi:hypothetical protein